jgi:hypothetical protein
MTLDDSRFCPHCGFKLLPGGSFCAGCGRAAEDTDSQDSKRSACQHCGHDLFEDEVCCRRCYTPVGSAHPERAVPGLQDRPKPPAAKSPWNIWTVGGVALLVYVCIVSIFYTNKIASPPKPVSAPLSTPTPNAPAKKPESTRPAAAVKPPADADLDASASVNGSRVVITNRSADHWFQVRMSINEGILDSGYAHEAEVIPAKTTLRFFPGIFLKSDGTRLNLENTAVKTINIHATVNGGRAHWNGAYR